MARAKGRGKSKESAAEALRNVRDTGVDFDSRTVYLFGAIDDESTYATITGLRALDERPGQLCLALNTAGGDVDGALAIYDAVKTLKSEVVTLGTGSVASAGALVLQAGKHRILTPNARFMIHPGSWNLGSAHANVVIGAGREMAAILELCCQIFASKSIGKSTPKQVRRMLARETYLSADEAVARGFADGILQVEG